MKHFGKTTPAIALVLLSGSLPAHAPEAAPGVEGFRPEGPPEHGTEPANAACRIQILVEQPGYLYTVPQIREMVQAADVAVRAIAVDSTQTLDGASSVRFRTTDVLHGPFPHPEFTFRGHFVDEDGFNTLSVPYQLVRRAGGSCHAEHYRQGGEYLFLLVRDWDHLTPYWFALGPTNEQIRGDDDPWLQWVREQLAQSPGP